ncbi:Leucine-rich repeat, partial [Sesbania bispinosa]
GSQGCLEKERIGLLKIKKLFFHSYKQVLPSWVDDREANCCGWERLSCNHTNGHVTHLFLEALFPSLEELDPKMKTIDFSFLRPFQQLLHLDLSDNHFTNFIDIEGLCGMKYLQELDLSHNSIDGLPKCMGNLKSLKSLKSLEYISFFDTNISGSFWFSLLANHSKLEVFRLSSVATNLHVETESPPWFPTFQLKALQLGNCNLNAQHNSVIPSFLLHQNQLRMIDLSHNKLQGDFPTWLLNNNPKLETLQLNNNSLTGSFQLSTYPHGLVNLGISKNKFQDQLSKDVGNILVHMSGLDLSCNELNGNIPPEIGYIENIYSLNLSHNGLSGSIPQSFSNLGKLESLDLSYNKLSGAIPPSLTELNFLAIFNVSYNNLSGPTPTTGQFANFGDDNYRGNLGLFGFVNGSTNRNLSPPPPPSEIPSNEEGENHTTIEMVSFYWGFLSSFVTVVLGLAIVLWFSPYWCKEWFSLDN